MWSQYILDGATLGGVVLGFIRLRKGQREIHVMVNSTLHAAIARGDIFKTALEREGIDIPKLPSDG